MGTRSLTFFHNQEKKVVVCMYGQYDGYMSGHGLELAKFINSKKMVNGLEMDADNTVANGMECLAALAVAHFKGDQPGNFYLYPADSILCGQEYTWRNVVGYNVYADKVVVKEHDSLLFSGSWSAFLEECRRQV